MSLDDFDDFVFFEWLGNSSKFFNSESIDMKSTALIVDNMISVIRSTLPHIDNNQLKLLHSNLQNTIEQEFSKKGLYENKILVRLLNDMRKSITNHRQETENSFQTSTRYERQNQRMHSAHNVKTLQYLILRNPPVDTEQRFIGLSYAYANLVNGIFRFTIQDCYTWAKISNGDAVDPDTIAEMDVSDIYNYYNQKHDLLYFEGYDSIVRNAVAHSNFEYDPSTQKISYVNEGQLKPIATGITPTNRQTVEYSFQELIEKYEQLEVIYNAIMIINQILMIGTCLAKLTERHP